VGRGGNDRIKLELMDAARLARTLTRMAHEILERHPDASKVGLVGVRSRGVPLARRLARIIGEAASHKPRVGSLDITLYRDDLTTIAAQPVMKGTQIDFSIDGTAVVLVDDVLFTGRTVRAALDELIDFGRPSRIELAVLVDRGHRELPIRPDYVGRKVATSLDEIVQVMLEEEDGEDRVVLLAKQAPSKAPAEAPAVAKKRPKARGR
jgi:pyrimidine operon attenuation protein / uracil phosphoribosyltransferase